MAFGDGLIHLPGDAAIGDVALRRAAQFGNVERLGKIHLEQRAATRSQRQKILRGFFRLWNVGARQGVERCVSLANRIFIRLAQVGVGDQLRHIVAMQIGETLDRLHAAAMAMHVAEAADIHENVEAQLVAGRKGARQLIMAAAMARAQQQQLLAARRIERSTLDRESDGRDSGTRRRAGW